MPWPSRSRWACDAREDRQPAREARLDDLRVGPGRDGEVGAGRDRVLHLLDRQHGARAEEHVGIGGADRGDALDRAGRAQRDLDAGEPALEERAGQRHGVLGPRAARRRARRRPRAGAQRAPLSPPDAAHPRLRLSSTSRRKVVGVVYPIFSCRRPTPRATAPPGLPPCSRPTGSRPGRSAGFPEDDAPARQRRGLRRSSARCMVCWRARVRRPAGRSAARRRRCRSTWASTSRPAGHIRASTVQVGAGSGGARGPLPAGRRVRARGSARARSRAGRIDRLRPWRRSAR